jgi:SAM-dependent methyltransferase
VKTSEPLEIPVRDDATELRTFRRGERVIDLLREAGIDVAGKNVVDLGAGFGSLSIAAAKAGAKNVVAVDVHAVRLEAIAARAEAQGVGVRVHRANLLESVVDVRDADVALLMGVVEYAGLWDRDAPVRELQRRVFKTAFDCLGPGGHLVFASKNRLWPRFVVKDANTGQPLVNVLPRCLADRLSLRLAGVPYRHHIQSPRSWARAMREVGFDSVDCFFPFLSYQLPLRLSRHPALSDLRLARARIQTTEEYDCAWGRLGSLRAAFMVGCAALRLPIAHSLVAIAAKPMAPR